MTSKTFDVDDDQHRAFRQECERLAQVWLDSVVDVRELEPAAA